MQNFAANIRTLALLISALVFCGRADAQGLFLSATESPNPVIVSNSMTYTVTVANQTGAFLQNIFVTNTLTLPVQVTTVSTNSGVYTNSVTFTSTSAIFTFGEIDPGVLIEMTMTVVPTASGQQTNFISVGGVYQATTNMVFANTNIVTQILATNTTADLGVTMSRFPKDIYENDYVTYEVSVTNGGPNSASNVVLSNSIPAGVEFLGISPTNQLYTSASNSIVINLATLTNRASKNFLFTIEPTNTGVFNFSATLISTNQVDTNSANDFFTTNIVVTNFLAGTSNLVASINSAQIFNRQTGRLQQIVTLSNAGPSTVAAARVIVSGLTNQLFNAVGTNSGNPFIVYGAPLAAGQSVNLTMQYYPNRSPFPFDNSQLQPVEIAPPDFSLPATGITSTNINIIGITNNLAPYGYNLVEFAAISNRTYTIAYKDSMESTNWLAAQPPFWTSANYVLWIDYGPPETLSNSPVRLYRVYMNPQTP